ncbi:hypothetical protein [Paenibacillus sp. sgz500992]|uniref:hypothetical protein n=1 Tax=Paenibacillus sp. sgz500992 TaxID=3242476 RepID=UPI0036D40875
MVVSDHNRPVLCIALALIKLCFSSITVCTSEITKYLYGIISSAVTKEQKTKKTQIRTAISHCGVIGCIVFISV